MASPCLLLGAPPEFRYFLGLPREICLYIASFVADARTWYSFALAGSVTADLCRLLREEKRKEFLRSFVDVALPTVLVWGDGCTGTWTELPNGKKHGTCVYKSKEGDIRSQEEYEDGVLHGKQLYWNAGGKLESLYHYVRGKRHGLCEVYYETGDPQCVYTREQYEDDWVHGLYECFHANGKKTAEYTNDHGSKHGKYRSWWDNGQLMQEGEYVHGECVGAWKSYYYDGQQECEEEYDTQGRLIGTRRKWHANGQLEKEDVISEDRSRKVSKLFWENGNRRAVRRYAPHTYRGSDAEPYAVFVKHGPLLKWRAGGHESKRGTWKYGKKVGVWRYYYAATGNLKEEIGYDEHGEKHGYYYVYDLDGKTPLRRTLYNHGTQIEEKLACGVVDCSHAEHYFDPEGLQYTNQDWRHVSRGLR